MIAQNYPTYLMVREFGVLQPFTGKYEIAGYATQEKIDRMQNASVTAPHDWRYAEPRDLIDGALWLKPRLERFTYEI
ncbi:MULTISPECIES: hypothetical protein [unclassified Beijerinckia]|uniref:hypothetical protein n=1 Tax=unclassified Beijerinckia TaxID=2638183 RepID=UPI00089CE851|nr:MULTISPECIES: hypothetical protein [unclassified Beijerinckia]MDH7797248.1 hypothetical protein [Beijerinckia sp. GAS462]SEC77964.1 hypothetical protein SAMN05443249_3540 [Beijerinckia sp. 28-YEA-48]